MSLLLIGRGHLDGRGKLLGIADDDVALSAVLALPAALRCGVVRGEARLHGGEGRRGGRWDGRRGRRGGGSGRTGARRCIVAGGGWEAEQAESGDGADQHQDDADGGSEQQPVVAADLSAGEAGALRHGPIAYRPTDQPAATR